MIVIPTKLFTYITFPGVIIHEVAHQLMCDLCGVPVYNVRYFIPDSDVIGRVVHAPIDSYYKSLCIGIAPLLLNSLVCMLLTIPMGTAFLFGTTFLMSPAPCMGFLQIVTSWLGFSSGFHAIPSKQDIQGLSELATTMHQKRIARGLQMVINVCNFSNLGFVSGVVYACITSLIIPALFFR